MTREAEGAAPDAVFLGVLLPTVGIERVVLGWSEPVPLIRVSADSFVAEGGPLEGFREVAAEATVVYALLAAHVVGALDATLGELAAGDADLESCGLRVKLGLNRVERVLLVEETEATAHLMHAVLCTRVSCDAMLTLLAEGRLAWGDARRLCVSKGLVCRLTESD